MNAATQSDLRQRWAFVLAAQASRAFDTTAILQQGQKAVSFLPVQAQLNLGPQAGKTNLVGGQFKWPARGMGVEKSSNAPNRIVGTLPLSQPDSNLSVAQTGNSAHLSASNTKHRGSDQSLSDVHSLSSNMRKGEGSERWPHSVPAPIHSVTLSAVGQNRQPESLSVAVPSFALMTTQMHVNENTTLLMRLPATPLHPDASMLLNGAQAASTASPGKDGIIAQIASAAVLPHLGTEGVQKELPQTSPIPGMHPTALPEKVALPGTIQSFAEDAARMPTTTPALRINQGEPPLPSMSAPSALENNGGKVPVGTMNGILHPARSIDQMVQSVHENENTFEAKITLLPLQNPVEPVHRSEAARGEDPVVVEPRVIAGSTRLRSMAHGQFFTAENFAVPDSESTLPLRTIPGVAEMHMSASVDRLTIKGDDMPSVRAAADSEGGSTKPASDRSRSVVRRSVQLPSTEAVTAGGVGASRIAGMSVGMIAQAEVGASGAERGSQAVSIVPISKVGVSSQISQSPFQVMDILPGSSRATDMGVATGPGATRRAVLEIGFQDPGLGYIELRTRQMPDGVHAQFQTPSAESSAVLVNQMSALINWMHDRQTPLESVAVLASSEGLHGHGSEGTLAAKVELSGGSLNGMSWQGSGREQGEDRSHSYGTSFTQSFGQDSSRGEEYTGEGFAHTAKLNAVEMFNTTEVPPIDMGVYLGEVHQGTRISLLA